jgi:hypothetical protein
MATAVPHDSVRYTDVFEAWIFYVLLPVC